MIRNMSVAEYNHLFQGGYIKDGFRDDVQDFLDYIDLDREYTESAELRELQQEYDRVESQKQEIESEKKGIINEMDDLQEKLRIADNTIYDRDRELKWMKALPEVRNALVDRYWNVNL